MNQRGRPRPSLARTRARTLGVLPRWLSSATSLVALGTGLLLSLVSEATVETRSNRSESASGGSSTDVHMQETETEAKPANQRWHRREVTVVLDPTLKNLPIDAADAIERAFSVWRNSGAFLPNVTFEYGEAALVALKPDGQNTILVAPITFAGHETDLAITVGFSNPSTGEISEADIVINQTHLFRAISAAEVLKAGGDSGPTAAPQEHESCTGSLDASACEDNYDLQNVLAHEVGHFFGLGENYEDTRATMFSCTSSCEIHKRDLNDSDLEEINALYEEARLEAESDFVAQLRAEGCSGVQIGGHPKTLKLHVWTGWSLLLMAAALRRRTNSLDWRKNHRR